VDDQMMMYFHRFDYPMDEIRETTRAHTYCEEVLVVQPLVGKSNVS
jgi:hypothetical protein